MAILDNIQYSQKKRSVQSIFFVFSLLPDQATDQRHFFLSPLPVPGPPLSPFTLPLFPSPFLPLLFPFSSPSLPHGSSMAVRKTKPVSPQNGSTLCDNLDAELPNEETIPTIDFGLLVNGTPEQRLAMVRLLATACEDWGFFMLVNHGIKDRLRDEMQEAFKAFFDLSDDEKGSYIRAHVLDPIRTGSGFNSKTDTGKCLRHYVKIFVHPEFHSVSKPHNFRNISKEYSESTRAIGLELLKAIWEGLGIEESQVTKAVKLGSCFQILVGNLYPPYPEPDSELGFAPHSDHGFLTLLYQNGVNGLQIMHKERWIYVKPVPNSIMVNTGDHLEIVSNGKYKSVLHRAVLNSEMARMSIVTVIGPSLDAIVEPIADLVNAGSPAVFRGLTYRDYLEHQQSNSLVEKGALNLVRLIAQR